ncbi:precorrin-6y C5,15-methyltransferase (decarboxylating) subunit CbiE [Azospirillum halopraeferens]|uniref:precorrin-6y C5,15-methyltransferase (decarboxylating) subunit CbiE n=1 Tax=Azospirillum halopraeferens TaxID=34010 RepID=UPI0003F4BFE0|nr:precorrin-6y C5,15-methyltransferase (decarboxylating) subunit CbiE [Azospirillum halopraeferens]
MISTSSPPAERWLSVVGIGEDGWDGLSPAARALVERAELLAGGARHLDLVPERPGQARLAWPSPLTDALPALLARRGRPVCVLASGDPCWYGIATTLGRAVPAAQTLVVPAPSAFSLAAARLGWALQDTVCLSVHGRPAELVLPHLQPGARLLALSWDGATPARLAALLRAHGFAASRLVVLERLGGPHERVWETTAAASAVERAADLNTVAIDCVAAPGARALPRTPGLPDAWFAHDGQITKREVRALTLSLLAPRRGERLWDVGAGSGSVAVEWMLADPANRAVAIEARPDRAARIPANAAAFGVPGLELVQGRAPDALAGLPAPDAVFIGGGVTVPGVIEACWAALPPGGRLCANAVTVEGEAVLAAAAARLGGTLTRVAVSRAEPLGGFLGWRPLSPITLWRADKPWGAP